MSEPLLYNATWIFGSNPPLLGKVKGERVRTGANHHPFSYIFITRRGGRVLGRILVEDRPFQSFFVRDNLPRTPMLPWDAGFFFAPPIEVLKNEIFLAWELEQQGSSYLNHMLSHGF